MGNSIKSVKVNIFNNTFEGQINFEPGLNIISGENGTLKTKLLQYIKGNIGSITFSDPQAPFRIQAISPKRNAERRNAEAIFQYFRTQNIKLDSVINERQINDQSFDNYPSLGDLFYVVYDYLCKDGGNQLDKMKQTTQEFNSVIRKIFQHYELISEWNPDIGAPRIKLLKSGANEVALEALSLGEQEILSLVVNLHTSRTKYDIFLIDEPEVHLNWHLEEKLFDYLDEFCIGFERQMIIVTHSRAIFKSKFLPKTQFFYWSNYGKVTWGQNLTKEQSRRIAGEAIEIIKLGDFSKTTFFVEDEAHHILIDAIARTLQVEVSITECENSSNVKSLFRQSKKEGGWESSYFLVDGDNEGNPYPDEDKFIHLEKYCAENYLLNVSVAAQLTNKSEDEIRQTIFDSVSENRHKILRRNKFFEFLFDSLKPEDMIPARLDLLDASLIFPAYLNKIGSNLSDYTLEYVKLCYDQGRLSSVFPKRLVDTIEKARNP